MAMQTRCVGNQSATLPVVTGDRHTSSAAQAMPVARFIDTAAYFVRRAERARDVTERTRLSEAADFYRALSRVVPALPAGFDMNGATPPNSRIRKWEARAEECRVLAEQLSNPHCRQQLARLAETYDSLALKDRLGS